MKRSLTLSGVALLVLALAVPAAFARGPRGGFGQGPGERGARMAENLGLNDQQVETMKKLRELHQTEMQAVRDQLRAKHEALAKLWQADAPDRAAIVAATKELSGLQAQLELKRVDHLFAVKSVLSAEQFKKFMESGPGMRGPRGMRGHHGRHGMRGMGPGMGMGPGNGMGPGMGRGMGPCGGGDGPDAPADDDAQDL
ncbi:MAG: periplasmic heavy metal sensor [Deltaproteobacteria bacterium]|nr:MAG: periplasmic heavy metal sensor [Deltaproteobacteria bacterium]